jgi:hypothetical protein
MLSDGGRLGKPIQVPEFSELDIPIRIIHLSCLWLRFASSSRACVALVAWICRNCTATCSRVSWSPQRSGSSVFMRSICIPTSSVKMCTSISHLRSTLSARNNTSRAHSRRFLPAAPARFKSARSSAFVNRMATLWLRASRPLPTAGWFSMLTLCVAMQSSPLYVFSRGSKWNRQNWPFA